MTILLKAAIGRFSHLAVSCTACIGCALFVFCWLSNDHYPPWLAFHAEAAAISALGFLSIAWLAGQPTQVKISKVSLYVGGLALVPWTQWTSGLYPFHGDAVMGSFYLLALALAIQVGSSHSTLRITNKPLPLSMVLIGGAATLSGWVGLMQWFGVQDWLGLYAHQTDLGERAMGNLGQPNHLATLLLMGFATILLLLQTGTIGIATATFSGLVFLSMLLATESRAGFMSMLVMSAYLLWKRVTGHLTLRVRYIALGVALAIVLRACVSPLKQALLIGDTRGLGLTDVDARWKIWEQVTWALLKNPWLGYGWNQTTTAHYVGSIASPHDQTYSHAHSIILDLAVWVGIPGAALIFALCLWWIFTRASRAKTTVRVYAFAALIPVGIHSLVEYPFSYGYFIVASGLLIGLIEADHEPARALVVPRAVSAAFLGSWVLCGALIVFEYLNVERDFQTVRYENLKIGITSTSYAKSNFYLLSHMDAMLQVASLKPSGNMPQSTIEMVDDVARRFPWGALALRNVETKALNGDISGAAHQLNTIRAMFGEAYFFTVIAHLKTKWENQPAINTLTLDPAFALPLARR